ncbi:hypothetical protein B0T21DRAFT_340107 [Apiosordaria backusii]|uniref:AAA+ ATPase domain-containing protein n=1 Tax=Apiosordaria backusii TaxID=314023 RepID=A0AA40AEH4_9PEZI|nr:hypothetical protein B0T21DRAFT_340107 [Apiosordaria backusii]
MEEKPPNIEPVELTARFFDLHEQLAINAKFWNVHRENAPHQPGLYKSDHDSQQLIRVLCARTPTAAHDLPAVPDPKEIELFQISVLSNPIAAFFASHLKVFEGEIGIDKGNGRLVRFNRPFKPVIRLWKQVKETLRKLEMVYGGAESVQSGSSNGADLSDEDCNEEKETTEPPQRSSRPGTWKTSEGLLHFRIFVELVDTYLGDRIRLYNELRGEKRKAVAFEHLWMLFDVGDDIYCPSRQATPRKLSDGESRMPAVPTIYRPLARYTPQIYRVTAVTGGTFGFWAWPREDAGSNRSEGTDGVTGSSSPQYLSDKPLFAARNNLRDLAVYCYYLDFNGHEYGCVPDLFVFKPYDREIDICSLEAYPVTQTQKTELEIRGQKFINATSVSHMKHLGFTVGPNREEIDSAVIVDMKMAFTEDSDAWLRTGNKVPRFISIPESRGMFSNYPGGNDKYAMFGAPTCGYRWCEVHIFGRNFYSEAVGKRREKVEEEIRALLDDPDQHATETQRAFITEHLKPSLLHLLPGAVPGFALRNRKWALLDLARLQPVEHNYGWNNLVLPSGHRKMVQAMVETHATENRDHHQAIGMDSVPGKGKGCIILLHGVPGVGKRSTAECVAAHTKKPLYPITCVGDIGYHPHELERNMERHFKLAHKWGCVLLLDEADVFLAKRDQRDVHRNGLVSVFLRILEYYSGILFLTTNRVGSIDDAFRSRLHLTLYYPRLRKDQTVKIFQRNFERVGEINKDRLQHSLPPFEYKDQEEEIINWAKQRWKALRWNGRQIRNAFQTVMALAEFKANRKQANGGNCKAPVLTKRHFEIVSDATIEFNEYLKAAQGLKEDEKARREQIRKDDFKRSSKKSCYESSSDESDTENSEEHESEDQTETEEESDEEDSDDGSKKKGKKKGGKNSKAAKKGKATKGKKKEGKKEGSDKKKKGKKSDSEEEDEEDDGTEDEEDDGTEDDE